MPKFVRITHPRTHHSAIVAGIAIIGEKIDILPKRPPSKPQDRR
jgi:hypothetical protein